MGRRYAGCYHLDGLGNGGSSVNGVNISGDARPSYHPLFSRTGFVARNDANTQHVIKFDQSTNGLVTAVNHREGYCRFDVRVRLAPTTDQEIWSLDGVGTGSSGTDDLRLYLTSGLALKLVNDGGAAVPVTLWTSAALTIGTTNRVEIRWRYNSITSQPNPNPPWDLNSLVAVRLDGVDESVSGYADTGQTPTPFGIDNLSAIKAGSIIVHARANGGWVDVTHVVVDTPIDISGSSAENPTILTTATQHGLVTGDTPLIAGHGSTPDINGVRTVTVLSETTFSIPIAVTIAGSGGTVGGDWIGEDWRTTLIEPAGNGTHTGWTGGKPDWRARSPINPAGSSANAVTTASNGAKVSYLMESMAARGITGTIRTVLIAWYATQGTSAKPLVIRNGSEETLSTATWTASNWRVWRISTAGWDPDDDIEIGAVCQAASTQGLGAVAMIVEHDTPEPTINDGTVRAVTGTYTGDSAAQTIDMAAVDAEVDGQLPILLLVVPVGTNTQPWWWFNGRYGGSTVDAAISSFLKVWPQPGSFHVVHPASGASMNATGITYRWIALFDAKARFVIANAVSKHSTTPDPLTFPLRDPLGALAASFTPDFAFGARATQATNDAPGAAMYRGPGNSGDSTSLLASNVAPVTDRIQALAAGSLDLGTLIAGATAYDWSVLAGRSTVALGKRLLAIATYTGDGSGARNIALSLSGEAPSWAVAVPHNTDPRAYRVTGDSTGRAWLSGNAIANSITAMAADQVTVNAALNADTVVYDVFAITGGVDYEAPIAADDAYATDYTEELVVSAGAGVLANDDASFGGPLTALLVDDVPGGHTLALASNGSFTYTPPSGFFGPATFTYRAVNAHSTQSAAVATVTITVAPPPAPVAVADAYETPYRTEIVVPSSGVLGNDTLNDDLVNCSVQLQNDANDGDLVLASNGSFTYLPRLGFSGEDRFSYRALNSNPATPSNTVNVTIDVGSPIRPVAPTTIPLVFARIILAPGGSPQTTYVIAETALADSLGWYEGFKPARILRVSPIRRELARDGYRAQTWTLEIADIDRQWREISNTTTIEGAYVELYWVDDAVRRAEGEPVKLTAGLVSTHRALGGFRYELTIEDVLGRRFTEIFQQPMIPFKRLSVSEFPELEDARDGTVLQIGYGSLSDEAAVVPRGVVPAFFVGTSNLSAIGGIDRAVDALILVGHAVADIIDLYYNLPAWAPEETAEVGDLIHPTPSNENDHKYVATVAGTTGASEPTWPTGAAATVVDGTVTWQEDGSFDPQLRYRVPAAAYDVLLVTPYKPNWTAATSLTVNYVDYNGFRYTPIFVDHVHRAAKMIREGRIILTANLDGIEDVGDGTGALIESAEEFAVHLLANYVFGAWQQGGWLTLPNLESGLPIVDLDSVTAAKAVADARQGSPAVPYRAAVLLGADGQPRTFFDVLADLLVGGDLEVGQNRHGQLFFSREDAAAPAAVSYDAVLDIVDGAFDTNIEREIRTNRVEYSFGERYVTPDAPVAAGREGEPLPASSIETRGQWESGVQYLLDTAAQDAVQRVIIQRLENRVVRDTATATDIAEHVLTRGVGPVASKDGPRTARFSTRWQGLRKGGVDVDLGTVVGVTHPEGLSAAGWTDARVRVRVIEIDAQAGKVTLEGRVLDG